VTLSVTSMRDYNYYELIESAVIGVDLGGFPVCYAMNRDTWQSLSRRKQQTLDEAGDTAVVRTSRTLLNQVDSEVKQWKSDGIVVHRLKHTEALDRRLATVERRWIDAVVGRGMDRAAVKE